MVFLGLVVGFYPAFLAELLSWAQNPCSRFSHEWGSTEAPKLDGNASTPHSGKRRVFGMAPGHLQPFCFSFLLRGGEVRDSPPGSLQGRGVSNEVSKSARPLEAEASQVRLEIQHNPP